MRNNTLHQTKIKTKRLIGRCVYNTCFLKNIITQKYNIFKKELSKNRNKTLTQRLISQWKLISLIALIFFGFYYGLGAIISSTIHNELNVKPKIEAKDGQHTLTALNQVIKTQVDTSAWTPGLPIIFPAAVLDNLPNFQIGVKESANYFIKKLAKQSKNKELKAAGELLDYPENIWLFSQTKDDMLAPGSAKQYRKALAHIETALNNNQTFTDNKAYLLILKNADKLLTKEIGNLNKHIREHEAEALDFKSDNLFYKTLGTVYTLHYILVAATKDFQTQILATEQYENFTSAIKFLEDASALNPVSVKNASPNDAYEANHLFYLAFYLSQAQNKLQEIYYVTLLKSAENENAD